MADAKIIGAVAAVAVLAAMAAGGLGWHPGEASSGDTPLDALKGYQQTLRGWFASIERSPINPCDHAEAPTICKGSEAIGPGSLRIPEQTGYSPKKLILSSDCPGIGATIRWETQGSRPIDPQAISWKQQISPQSGPGSKSVPRWCAEVELAPQPAILTLATPCKVQFLSDTACQGGT
jgi:hypothetical protein